MTKKILIVEDEASQRRMIALLVQRKVHLDAIEADSGRTALSILQNSAERDNICLAIIDLKMPEMDGIELLEIIKQQRPDLPVIILTGSKDLDIAIKVMKLGASDFLNKPVDPERFQISIHNSLKIGLLEKEVTRLKKKDENIFSFENLIGHDQGLLNIVNIGRKAAATDISVLLNGETGVGKEIFARAIHGESARAGKPFIAINCGAIPKNLIESTLFGHEKGSFTGAISKSLGHFREAEGGTIFLDEIGELPLNAQVKLLRVLQEKEIHPVGSNKSIAINVRIISATNRDLEMDIAKGLFRDDLYFRLNILPINLPPLRKRKGDIPLLINHFIERFSACENLPLKSLTENAEKMLINMPWNGNVRELENIIHRAIILCEGDILDVDDFKDLSKPVVSTESLSKINHNKSAIPMFDENNEIRTIKQIEIDAIKFALQYYDNNITRAALALNMAKSTFYRKLKKMSDD